MDMMYVEAGDIIVVIPGQLHGITQLENYSMEYENIIFSSDMLISKHSDSLESEVFIPLMSGMLSFNHLITLEDDCLDRADNICKTFPKGYQLALKGYLFEFFYIIYNSSCENMEVKNNKNLDKLKDILGFIEKNYQHSISIEDISSFCNFSPSHFMKFFKKSMGTSFIDYLNDYRLSASARMLLSSDDNIIDIAAACGYDNLSYYNRIFKRKYHVTPSRYRNSGII